MWGRCRGGRACKTRHESRICHLSGAEDVCASGIGEGSGGKPDLECRLQILEASADTCMQDDGQQGEELNIGPNRGIDEEEAAEEGRCNSVVRDCNKEENADKTSYT